MEREFKLLKQYLHELIDRMKPVTLDYQISAYSKRGYIEYGHSRKDFMSFEKWKTINQL